MKKLITFVFVSIFIISSVQSQNEYAAAESALQQLTKNETVIGVSGAISVNGKTVFKTSFGYADEKSKTPFTAVTLSRTASIAKSMTAIAVLQLFEKGIIDLDAPIQTYIKEFPVKKEGVITVRHLLNHSSGIKGYKSKESGTKKEYANLTEAMKVFMNRDIIGKHGIEENYTTYGYVVLGVLIERVSNQTYESYMEENIWNKIEMNNTGVEHFEVAYDNKSKLYHRNRRGKIKEAKKANNLSNRIPGGGFYSTVDDLLKFGQAVIDFALISKETTALMLEFQNTKYDGNPYAFGWHLYGRSTSRASVVGHGGEQTGVSAQLMVAPQRNMVIVVMSNTFGSYNEVRGTSIQLVETAVKLDNIKRANAE